MKKAQKVIADILFSLTAILLVTVFILSVSSGLKFPLLAIIIGVLALYLFRYKHCALRLAKRLLSNKAVLVVVIIISLLARLAPLILNFEYQCKNDLSDTGVHYFGAQELVNGGGLDAKIANYEKTFPYLYPYTLFLSASNRILGNINTSVVLSNIILDSISCFFIYLLLNKLHPSSKRMGILLWSIFRLLCAGFL